MSQQEQEQFSEGWKDVLRDLESVCKERAILPEDLDDRVRDLFDEAASEVNNGGLSSQLDYLARTLGVERTKKFLQKVVPDR